MVEIITWTGNSQYGNIAVLKETIDGTIFP